MMNVSLEIKPMLPEDLESSLAVSDLTDPSNGIHAINLTLTSIIEGLQSILGWPVPEVHRHHPIVSVEENFDRLYFPSDNLSRSSVYARYVSLTHLLRTHTSAAIPDLLKERTEQQDRILVCPGICYRRDVADRIHCGEPHQVDIWRVKIGAPFLRRRDLLELIEAVLGTILPGRHHRENEVKHPYTVNGLEVEVEVEGKWLEVLECGEINPKLLIDAGLNPQECSGLAMGIGLDRLVMLIKGMDDIRLLRAKDPRIRRQMTDLEPYISVSKYPPIRHDLSIAVSQDTQPEDIAEAARVALGEDVDALEEVSVVEETAYKDLPPRAIERLGITPDQKNLLVRMIFRSHERSLTQKEANVLRDTVYAAIHRGSKMVFASR